MKAAFLILLPFTTAWPHVMDLDAKLSNRIQKRADVAPRPPTFLSKRPNTGAGHPDPAPFNAQEQYVDVSPGSGHEFQAPKSTDLRGECPGLNAAANHGFLPRNGLPTIADTITGLADAYNMSPDLALALAAISVALGGDPITQTWSIGGSFKNTLPLPTSGILGFHNRYEGDASIIRGDAYLNGGSVGVFQDFKWKYLVGQGEAFTLDNAANQSDYNTRWSIANNPYYFSAPFSGLVAPAAHDFVINFMSNRSEESPGGTLTQEVLQSFFSVTGDDKSFTHTPGLERIPDNFYKRPTSQQYNILNVFQDLFVNNAMYPGSLRFGGNTGTVNSFVGVELGDLTNGLYNLDTLAEGNNAACFFLQAASAGIPDAAVPVLGLGISLVDWLVDQLGPLSSKLECAQLQEFNTTIFQQFPGYSYQASGNAKRSFHAN